MAKWVFEMDPHFCFQNYLGKNLPQQPSLAGQKKPIHPASQNIGYDSAEKHSIDLSAFNVHPW